MHVLYAWLSCRPSDAVPCTWGMPQKHPRGQLWQRRHGLYALANNNKPHKNYVISSDLFFRTQKSFFGVFIRLKIEDEKLRQTALGCYLIWSRELYKCLFAISCRLALTTVCSLHANCRRVPRFPSQHFLHSPKTLEPKISFKSRNFIKHLYYSDIFINAISLYNHVYQFNES